MKIAMAFDHAGYDYKLQLIKYVEELGHQVMDFGTNSQESCDYTDFCIPACEAVAQGRADRGIVVCGTGIGMSIMANKVKGVRCALCHESFSARMTREHNDANVLALGARVTGLELAKDMVAIFLGAPFSNGENHVRRVGKITGYEN